MDEFWNLLRDPPKPYVPDERMRTCCCCGNDRDKPADLCDIKNAFETECPTLWKYMCETMKDTTFADPASFLMMFFCINGLGRVYDEKGRAGLRELEEQYKKNVESS